MRIILALFIGALLLIAIAGIGFGIAVVVDASHQARQPGSGLSMLAALAEASIPFLIGTVALGSVTIVMAVIDSRVEQVAAIQGAKPG